jgi:glutathione S-transferase
MKLLANPTSPFVRIVRMALIEKGLDAEVETVPVDAWGDERALLEANPAGRVPALVTRDGVPLTEALLILSHLDTIRLEPRVLTGAPALSCAGLAVGVFDAAVAILIGRKSAPDFDTGFVGAKRFRTMHEGLARLDAALPPDGPFDIGPIAAITALDYLLLRFPDKQWRDLAPKLVALREAQAERRSVKDTAPVA